MEMEGREAGGRRSAEMKESDGVFNVSGSCKVRQGGKGHAKG